MAASDLIARVRQATSTVLARDGHVSPVNVLVQMGCLTPAHLEDWRRGRVPYLERVVQGSLGKLSRVLREVQRLGHELGLSPSATVYHRHGKGPRQALRFSRSGDPNVERAYATHWVSRRARRPPAPTPDAAAPAAGAPRRPALTSVPVPSPPAPLERDPARIPELAEARSEAHLRLRAYLKEGHVPSRRVDARFRRLHAEVAAAVDCTACSACCEKLSVRLTRADVARLARRLGLTPAEFRERTICSTPQGLQFAQQPCPLLEDRRCTVYEDRPAVCRAYPHLHRRDMTRRLLTVLANARVCPIVLAVLERLGAELSVFEAPLPPPEGF